jgi:murein L,D-transpeptidase YcbB/YkuD
LEFALARYSLVFSRISRIWVGALAAVIVPAGFFTAALAGHAAAGDSSFDNQAEWAQGYDADEHLAVTRSSTPVLSPQTFAATEQATEHYRRIVADGGWAPVPSARNLKLGSQGDSVVALRRRLATSGDLDPSAGTSPVFDSYVDAAVRHFQARHGLNETGIVDQDTFTAMNVPADVRLRQLEINIVRLKAYSGNLGERFVMANIPAAAVETVENDVVVTRHIAGVGRIDRQSPVMMTKATEINFNPYWTVPVSIIRKDLIPKMQANPNYLSEHKIRIFDKEGSELQANQIDWNSEDAVNYKFRQDTGGDVNSLGVVRINIPNPYGVYMHDTPEKGIFGDDDRFISSGCIRVQNVRDYVAWLLKDTAGWDRNRIDEVIRSGEQVDVKLAEPVPVYWVYVTGWATPGGLVQFRDDIYQRDGLGSVASDQMPGQMPEQGAASAQAQQVSTGVPAAAPPPAPPQAVPQAPPQDWSPGQDIDQQPLPPMNDAQ